MSSMTPYGYERNGCGYCGSRARGGKTSASYYASSKDMRPEHYQALADRGWRRSGSTYYKPDLRNACCPHYTIRLDTADFRPTRNQRKAVNLLNKYLIGQEYKRAADRLTPRSREEKRFRQHNWNLDTVVHEAEDCQLAKPIDPRSGVAVEPAHTLHITLEPDSFTEDKYALFENYQRIVHREPPGKITRSGFRSFLCSGFPQSYESESATSHESSAASSHSATTPATEPQNGGGKRLGSFHQCYRIDGRLVALGVLDLLPHAVSSVYLIYHESVADWQFGKVSAMQEIALARKHDYKYYYMGYYIHSCPKMKYKIDYRPQYVLDPLSYEWHQADDTLWASLNSAKMVAFIDGKWSPQNRVSGAAGETSGQRHDAHDDGNVWTAEMPGVLSVDYIAKSVTPDRIQARARDIPFQLSALVGQQWDVEKIMSRSSIQYVCAEWIACVGADLLEEIHMQLGPYFRS